MWLAQQQTPPQLRSPPAARRNTEPEFTPDTANRATDNVPGTRCCAVPLGSMLTEQKCSREVLLAPCLSGTEGSGPPASSLLFPFYSTKARGSYSPSIVATNENSVRATISSCQVKRGSPGVTIFIGGCRLCINVQHARGCIS